MQDHHHQQQSLAPAEAPTEAVTAQPQLSRQTAETAVLQALQTTPAAPQAAASQQAAELRTSQELLRQAMERIDAAAPAASSETQDEAQLLASQAAELASARQAMQLMLQLLEQAGVGMQHAQATSQPAEHEGASAIRQEAQPSAEVHSLLRELLHQMQLTAAQDVPQDQGQALAAQAAELASARQAMQLMLQLLEQQAGAAAADDSAVQASHQTALPAVRTAASVTDVAGQHLPEHTSAQAQPQVRCTSKQYLPASTYPVTCMATPARGMHGMQHVGII